MNPLDWIDDEIEALDAGHLLRQRTTCQGLGSGLLRVAGQKLINFASNDYLGLAADPRLVAAAGQEEYCDGWGATASPSICGRHAAHERLEHALARFEGTESALLFPTGFAANLGTIPSLVGQSDAIFSDEKNHASIIDGCRLSRATVFVYPHANVDRLEALLGAARGYRRRLIVTDSLFSMDGDMAPLSALADLAENFQAMLMVDEAHATGVFGQFGRGVCELTGVESRVHVRVGTLSKALGSAGGFVAGSRSLIEWLVNRARSYIFSTALPPACCRAALAALEIVASEPQRREMLLKRAAELNVGLVEQGWSNVAGASQIQPVIVGQESAALQLAVDLRQAGFFVPAIRTPSVAPGQARLRVSLSYAHTPEMIQSLLAALGARSGFISTGSPEPDRRVRDSTVA